MAMENPSDSPAMDTVLSLSRPGIPDETNKIDEEADDRDEFHCEKHAEDFTEAEEPILHDVLPDEAEGPQGVDETILGRGDGKLYKGQTFFNAVAFKEAVVDYALHTGRNIKQYKYDICKICYKCAGSGDCKWQVYAFSLPKDPIWTIRVHKPEHKCIPNGRCELFKTPVIARIFLDKIREEPDYYFPMKMEEIIKEKWKISVSRPQCQAARNKALRWVELQYDQQFARLHDYAAEIRECNKDSVVEVDTVKNGEGLDVYHRFYVCFDVLRRTWKASCRPLIGVDGCFLKAKIKGQLLVAVGRDADNAIYPIAWGVVPVENIENWVWFMNRLKIDLDLGETGEGYVLVSDRQKGLIRAVQIELPKMEHRNCVRHIYGNLKKNHPSKTQLKPLLWSLAWSYNESQFAERLERIHSYDTKVYDDVMKSKPKTWCRAFYKLGSYCEDVENNSTESFNKTINKAREKPFMAMLEMIRRLAMMRIARRSTISNSHTGLCTPYVTRFLAQQHDMASSCRVSSSTNGMYEVSLAGKTHRVSLNRHTCTCKKYQICGIPCEHSYGVILAKKLVVEDYVCQWFRTPMWKRNYEEGLVPQRGPQFWPSTLQEDVKIPPAPAQSGKTKVTKAEKKRRRGVCESPIKKAPKAKKREMTCGACGGTGHNCRSHKKDQQTQASQGDLTQESQVQDG